MGKISHIHKHREPLQVDQLQPSPSTTILRLGLLANTTRVLEIMVIIMAWPVVLSLLVVAVVLAQVARMVGVNEGD